MAFHCWVFRRWAFPSNMDKIPTTYYILYNYMTCHCWVFRCWVFHSVNKLELTSQEFQNNAYKE